MRKGVRRRSYSVVRYMLTQKIKAWITRNHQSVTAQKMLELVHLMHEIQTQEQAHLWISAFIDWYQQHKTFIYSVNEVSGRWRFTHKMLRQSVSHIKCALPDLFSYTRYHNEPKSSESIESLFGHLKDNIRIHRELSTKHFKYFVKWHLFLNSNDGIINKSRCLGSFNSSHLILYNTNPLWHHY